MSAPVLVARELTRHYEVSRGPLKKRAVVKALNGASLEVHAGETLAVVGESGCGKSTLARVLTMIEPPTSGELEIGGKRIDISLGRPSPELRRSVQIVFQNPYGSLNPRKTVADMLDEPLRLNTDLSRAARANANISALGSGSSDPSVSAMSPNAASRYEIAVWRVENFTRRPRRPGRGRPVEEAEVHRPRARSRATRGSARSDRAVTRA